MNMKRNRALIFSCLLTTSLLAGCQKNEESTIGSTNTKEMSQTTTSTISISTSRTISSTTKATSSSTQSSTVNQATEETVSPSSEASAKRQYTNDEKQAIATAFSDWAENRAAIGGMALNDAYFDHGASGVGDWYAVVDNGQRLLVQRQDPNINVSQDAYIGEALGGVVFYTSKNGTVGYSNELNDPKNQPSLAAGFSQVANLDKPIVKYLLGSNGVVYEFQSSGSFSDGFYETSDQGDFNYWPTTQVPFKISEDAAAQETLQTILAQYNQ